MDSTVWQRLTELEAFDCEEDFPRATAMNPGELEERLLEVENQ